MTDDLEQRVHQLIYDADPEIPAAAVIALVRAAVADEIMAEADRRKAARDAIAPSPWQGSSATWLRHAARIADPSRTASLPEGN